MKGAQILKGLSYEEYEAIDAVRQSWLNKLADSPAHLKWHLDHRSDDEEESDALRIGTAVDTACFFPDEFARKYVAMPKVKRNTKVGKEFAAAFEFDNAGKTILTEPEYRDVLGMCRSITECKSAMGLLEGAENQLAIVWTDEATGVRCKARLDGWNEKLNTAFDLKTTRSVRLFRKSLSDFGYHRQAAWYTEACAQAGLAPEHFCFIAVDKTPPHGVMVFRLVDVDIAQAWESCKKLLATYRKCMSTNVWPCYPDVVQDIALPEWARLKLMED